MDENESQVQITRIVQTARTFRFGIVTAGIVIGVVAIAVAIVKCVRDTTWPDIVMIVVLMALAPSGVIALMAKTYFRNVKKNNGRVAELEKTIDPARSSSLGGKS